MLRVWRNAVSESIEETELGDTNQLTKRILIGLAAGMLVGVVLNRWGQGTLLGGFLVDGVFYVGGKIFLSSLKSASTS